MGHVGWGGSCSGGVCHTGVEWESHLTDKSQITLLSELLPIHIQLFTNDSKIKKNSNL